MLRYEQHPSGRRAYLFGRRWHHGLAGAELIACAAIVRPLPRWPRRIAMAIGAMMFLHDVRDFPFRDTDNH